MPLLSKQQIDLGVRELSPLSDAAQSLVRLTHDREHTGADVVEIVERDAALTIRVLRIANSPFVAAASPVESLKHAITLMGERAVVTAALAVGANWMREPLAGYGRANHFFDDGLRSAVGASLIARRLELDNLASLAYTGGLLHDIGMVVLSPLVGPSSAAVIADPPREQVHDLRDIEKSELGVDHAEVGASVADHFDLGPALRSVIEHHHAPAHGQPKFLRLTEIVNLSDSVVSMLAMAPTGDPDDAWIEALEIENIVDPAVLRSLGLDRSDLNAIVRETRVESENLLAATNSA